MRPCGPAGRGSRPSCRPRLSARRASARRRAHLDDARPGERREQRQDHQLAPGRGDQERGDRGHVEEDEAGDQRLEAARGDRTRTARPARARMTTASCSVRQGWLEHHLPRRVGPGVVGLAPPSCPAKRSGSSVTSSSRFCAPAGRARRRFPGPGSSPPRPARAGARGPCGRGRRPGLRLRACARSAGRSASRTSRSSTESPSASRLVPMKSALPPPVEIGTKRSSSTALWIVHGASTSSRRRAARPRPAARRSARARPSQTPRRASQARGRPSGERQVLGADQGEQAEDSARTRASAHGSPVRRRLLGGHEEQRRAPAAEQRRRQRLGQQQPLVLEQGRVEGDHPGGPISPATRPAEAAAEQVGRAGSRRRRGSPAGPGPGSGGRRR